MSIITLISLIIATIIPLAALYIIYTRDLYSTGSRDTIGISFVWGMIAFAAAYAINRYFLFPSGIDFLDAVKFIVPIEEEILKGVVLLYLVRRRQFSYFVDGAIYGFAIGIGFAVVENYSYLLATDQSFQLSVAIVRVISTNLMHAAGSSIIGISMGHAKFSRRTGRILIAASGLIIAGVLHIANNVVSNEFSNQLILIFTIITIGVISFGVIVTFIRAGLKQSKTWIEEKLGMADRVTSGETKAVLDLENIEEILKPLSELFGQDKANDIETLLKKQARLGILRKSLDKIQDEKFLAKTQTEMDEVRAYMERARKAIGAYPMLYLRGVFPEEDSLLWGQLEHILAEKIATSPTPQAGGLWDQLNQQVAPPTQNVPQDE